MPNRATECSRERSGPPRPCARRGYALLVVVMVLAGMGIAIGVFTHTLAINVTGARLRACARQARWAADAAVEETIWNLGRHLATGRPAPARVATRSNDCAVEVTVTAAGPGRWRVVANAVYSPADGAHVRRPARACITVLVEADASARRLRVARWTEGELE